MEPAEAVYPSAETDNRGDFLTGAHRYRLHIPVGGIPVDVFWSLSMYELMPDGRLFFLENPIKRYAIGDRTRGLKKNAAAASIFYSAEIHPVAIKIELASCPKRTIQNGALWLSARS